MMAPPRPVAKRKTERTSIQTKRGRMVSGEDHDAVERDSGQCRNDSVPSTSATTQVVYVRF